MVCICDSGAFIPISGSKYQVVILFHALGTIFVLRAGIRLKITQNFVRSYRKKPLYFEYFSFSLYWYLTADQVVKRKRL